MRKKESVRVAVFKGAAIPGGLKLRGQNLKDNDLTIEGAESVV